MSVQDIQHIMNIIQPNQIKELTLSGEPLSSLLYSSVLWKMTSRGQRNIDISRRDTRYKQWVSKMICSLKKTILILQTRMRFGKRNIDVPIVALNQVISYLNHLGYESVTKNKLESTFEQMLKTKKHVSELKGSELKLPEVRLRHTQSVCFINLNIWKMFNSLHLCVHSGNQSVIGRKRFAALFHEKSLHAKTSIILCG